MRLGLEQLGSVVLSDVDYSHSSKGGSLYSDVCTLTLHWQALCHLYFTMEIGRVMVTSQNEGMCDLAMLVCHSGLYMGGFRSGIQNSSRAILQEAEVFLSECCC